MYFKNFPYTQYQFPDEKIRIIQNLSIRPHIVEEFIQDATNLQEFLVEEGMTPENIAFEEYGDAALHWIILLANNIFNLHTDWPKGQKHLHEFVREKYRVQKTANDSDVIMTDVEVDEFTEFVGTTTNNFQSYNSANVLMRPHHFEDANGVRYSYDTATGEAADSKGRVYVKPELFPISIFDYEFLLNEKRRTIVVPSKDTAIKMKRELGKLLNE